MSVPTITEFFRADHQRLDATFAEFRMRLGEDLSKAKEHFKEFRSGLERHIQWEEELLFPLFERATGMTEAGPTAVMRSEHSLLRQTLDRIHSVLREGRTDAQADAQSLIAILGEHNHKEENVLYPMIDRLATDKDRAAIFEGMKALPERRSCCCGTHV